MPYKKKYNTKRRYKNSKLKDKKINTLIEKRIQEISRKEDRKQEQYTVCRDNVTADGTWPQNISRPLNPVIVSSGSVNYKVISQCARQYWVANPLNIAGNVTQENAGQDRPTFQKYRIGVKTVQAHLWVENFFPRHTQFRCALIFVPNYNSSTTAISQLAPSIHQMGRNSCSGKFTGIFGDNAMLKNNRNAENSAIEYTLIDSKTITLPPRRMDNYYTNSTVGGDTFNVVQNFSIPSKKKITLTRTYKNPKKLYANSYDFDEEDDQDDDQPSLLFSNGNYFLLMAHDSAYPEDELNYLSVYGMSGLKLTEPEVSGRNSAG